MVGSVTRADDATQNWQQVACALEGHQLEAGYAEALGHDAAWDGELPQAISAVDAPEPAETASAPPRPVQRAAQVESSATR